MKLISSHCDGRRAGFVRVEEPGSDPAYAEVEHSSITEGEFACFEYNGNRYLASRKDSWNIMKLPSEPEHFTERFVTGSDSLGRPSRSYLMAVYGLNRMKIEAADTFTVAMQEVVSPFYLFQYFAVAIWLYTDYVIYSVVVLFITAMSITFCVKAKLFNLKRLHDLAGSQHPVLTYDRLKARRASSEVSDQSLVPGDSFVVSAGMVLPADCILIQGRVVVDESMLTGESVPVTKTEYRHSSADPDATKRTANILYSGTRVKLVYQGAEAVAVTYKTGFRSARGELIAALITPKNEVVSFMPDALLAILFMVVITTAIFGWSADQLKKLDTSDSDVVIAYLTALTIAVPPGLVACLSIGTSISVTRLISKQVTITDTGKLNAAGYVSYACFDKTGTLTDENIVFQGTKLFEGGEVSHSPLLSQIANETMSTCHSLSIVEGKPAGDPLEVELFAHPGWTLSVDQSTSQMVAVPPAGQPNGGKPHLILRQFEFSPEKLRAATLLSRPGPSGPESVLLLKGSPEVIAKMAIPSTVPKSFQTELTDLAKQGFRVLALAYRNCPESREQLMSASQTDLERELTFLGLVYFSNKLKPDTFPATIQSLHQARIHVNMITGDHFHTAAAISADCSILTKGGQVYLIDAPPGVDIRPSTQPIIIDPATEKMMDWEVKDLLDLYYRRRTGEGGGVDVEAHKIAPAKGTSAGPAFQVVVTGAGFQCLREALPEHLEPICRIASVFARMKPADKKHVVQELMKPNSRVNPFRECHVLFCGDGANDMEALSTATVGVSLCDTATTVAAAIVSTAQSPLAVVDVLKEGRCSLVTAYTLVNFNIMYAIIQLFMTCFLNNVGLVFGDYMYLIQDMFYSLFLGLCIANTPPSDTLDPKLPPQTLFCPGLMAKLLIQLGIFPAFQAITLAALRTQDWYTPFQTDDPLNESYASEGAALNIVALAQLMIASVVVTIGQPYRQAWYTNKSHLAVLLLHTSWIMYLLFGQSNEFMVGIDNKPAPRSFQGILVGIIAANVFVSAVATKAADLFF